MAEPILPDERRTLNIGGVRIEAEAWKVPPSEEYPNGVKYRFQALDEDDDHLARWDNTNDAHGPRHHRHLPDGDVEQIENPPESPEEVKKLLREFVREVTQR
ncbi:MAG: DUF6516 family protein [Halobacteriales archaeon]|nr:DUF6516 family protein [Halobacteriales archaeon]